MMYNISDNKRFQFPGFACLDELETAMDKAKQKQECNEWEPTVVRRSLHMRVLCVAHTRIEGAWSAYCSDVPGINHDNEQEEVLRVGCKLLKEYAQVLFPEFKGIPYAE